MSSSSISRRAVWSRSPTTAIRSSVRFVGDNDSRLPVRRSPRSRSGSRRVSAAVRGNVVTWDRWRLRVGLDPRRGLEVHDVAFRMPVAGAPCSTAGRSARSSRRMAIHLLDLVPPRRGRLRHGDLRQVVGGATTTCPRTPVPRLDDARSPRAAGHRAARDRDLRAGRRDPLAARERIAAGAPARRQRPRTIDNYDYQFNWIFGQDGTIECEVVLSGIMNVNPTLRSATPRMSPGTQAGHLVAPGINAPNHQHFFGYRLDLDVDGKANTVYTVDTAPARRAQPEGRDVHDDRAAARHGAQGDLRRLLPGDRMWRVANTHPANALGQFTGYTLVPGAASPAFARPGRRRCGRPASWRISSG